MTSSRPYLLRALYDWIVDNGLTPHLLVNAEFPQARVPVQYVEQGRIVLNIAQRAVSGLLMTNEDVSFSARFGGQPMTVHVPIGGVVAIYARENGQGMFFGDDDADPTPPEDRPGPKNESEQLPDVERKPTLRVVK
ncbi:MAG: ClpXP protease specificity-enhancing factor [Gammaproteobacteria bacterium]|nr:ClpXP protease specificity-enhancing factor [Gammaproteobacteria bacterium]MCP5136104.1 ClpXP protease specificity-enhancing factor [Gammaproteobacteria bacterium]